MRVSLTDVHCFVVQALSEAKSNFWFVPVNELYLDTPRRFETKQALEAYRDSEAIFQRYQKNGLLDFSSLETLCRGQSSGTGQASTYRRSS